MNIVNNIRDRYNKIINLLSEKPKTDPVFEIQRLLRVSGFKIKNISYDDKGNANIELANRSDIEEVKKYFDTLYDLPATVSFKNDKILIIVKHQRP